MNSLYENFVKDFGVSPRYNFSAPGRTELGGNHTDHQHGWVLAGGVNLRTTAAVSPAKEPVIRVHSQGYAPCDISLEDLAPRQEEAGTTAALVRGIGAKMKELGCPLGGFYAEVTSQVLPGSGLSSSAAFEVLIASIFNHLFFDGRLSPVRLAQVGQYAENVYFGKPCGLMDQMACAMGGVVAIDFADPAQPHVIPVEIDFNAWGHDLFIIDSGADHAGLTEEYASIPGEMSGIANYFGKSVLRQVEEEDFYANLKSLRSSLGDRACLRAMHFYEENRRVQRELAALQEGNFPEFLREVNASGDSSWELLQNISVPGSLRHQEIALALGLTKKLLRGRGACRVHGGGFAGTLQAFVPRELSQEFSNSMEELLGKGACHSLALGVQGVTVRPLAPSSNRIK